MTPAEKRQARIRKRMKKELARLLDDAGYWRVPIVPGGESEPQWTELREAIVDVLFETEVEMAEQMRYSQYVRKHCI